MREDSRGLSDANDLRVSRFAEIADTVFGCCDIRTPSIRFRLTSRNYDRGLKMPSGPFLAFETLGIAGVLRTQSLSVPPYQRSYSWGSIEGASSDDDDSRAPVDEYWQDLKRSFEDGNAYFLGALVLSDSGGEATRKAVLDGQQRLATTSILLATIRDYFDSHGEASYGSSIGQAYVGAFDRTVGANQGDPFPNMGGSVFSASFGLAIPKEFHDDFLENRQSKSIISSTFSVIVGVHQGGPYAFVVSLEPTDSPFEGFLLAHSYLSQSLTTAESPVMLDHLEPEPFPMNFLLQPMPTIGPCIRSSPYIQGAFPATIFSYDPISYSDPIAAFRTLANSLASEIAVYYNCVHTNVKIQNEWISVAEESSKLVNLIQAKGFVSWWRRLRDLGGLTSALDIQLAITQIFEAEKLANLRTMLRVSYSGPSPWCLYDHTNMEIQDQPPNSSAQFAQIVALAGRRHAQSIQTFALVLAATVGAVAGFLASIVGRVI